MEKRIMSIHTQFHPAFDYIKLMIDRAERVTELCDEAYEIMQKYGLENGWIQNLD